MRLAICIPTHHGRAETLPVLLASLRDQLTADVEVCISDNASTDGTEALVAASTFPIRYHRFPTDQGGTTNFLHAVEMATAEWCWLIGSDDALEPGAVTRVLAVLRQDPPGLTVGKTNWDRTLTVFRSADHPVVLPKDPGQPRLIPADQTLDQLGMAFAFMGTHIFRREAWQVAVCRCPDVQAIGHSPHLYLLATMAGQSGWLWLPEPLVRQRLDNFTAMDVLRGDRGRYAEHLTEGLLAAFAAVHTPVPRALVRRVFIVYWNPFALLGYRTDGPTRRQMIRRCVRWFWGQPLFWLTAAPLLCSPWLPEIDRQGHPIPDWLLRRIAPKSQEPGWPAR
jgi:abequosyltransferase